MMQEDNEPKPLPKTDSIDLKGALQVRHPESTTELKHFCKEERSRISPERCAGQKSSFDVNVAKIQRLSYFSKNTK